MMGLPERSRSVCSAKPLHLLQRKEGSKPQARLKEEAAGKTINEEVGELFRIMGSFGEAVRLKLKRAKKLKLTEREDVGRALTADEEKNILSQAEASESPHIHTAVMIALNTGLRDSEIRNLQWRQIDFFKQL